MDRSLYTRPNKPKTITVTRRARNFALDAPQVPKPLAVSASTECHVTPPEVAGRMADYLELEPGLRVLEPSAGTGNLIESVIDYGCNVVAVEKHHDLCNVVRDRFPTVEVHQCDFLDFFGTFDRVIINPPFKTVKQHIAHALTLLSAGGVMVALVPVTFAGGELLETLPAGTFKNAAVTTKIVRFYK